MQDLIKYYLVACHKAKNKAKLTEFFTNYSKEILTRNASLADPTSYAEELRKWYILPYLENPADDKDFYIYFSQKWLDNLKSGTICAITSLCMILQSACYIFTLSIKSICKCLTATKSFHVALFNYITIVLRSAPAPRLLLIDKWFRSDTQVNIRT